MTAKQSSFLAATFMGLIASAHAGDTRHGSVVSGRSDTADSRCDFQSLTKIKEAMATLATKYSGDAAGDFYGGFADGLNADTKQVRSQDLAAIYGDLKTASYASVASAAGPSEAFGAYMPVGRNPYIEIAADAKIRVSLGFDGNHKIQIKQITANGAGICSEELLAAVNSGQAPVAAVASTAASSADPALQAVKDKVKDIRRQIQAQHDSIQPIADQINAKKLRIDAVTASLTMRERAGFTTGHNPKVQEINRLKGEIDGLNGQINQVNGNVDRLNKSIDAAIADYAEVTHPDLKRMRDVQDRVAHTSDLGGRSIAALDAATTDVNQMISSTQFRQNVRNINNIMGQSNSNRAMDNPLVNTLNQNDVRRTIDKAKSAITGSKGYFDDLNATTGWIVDSSATAPRGSFVQSNAWQISTNLFGDQRFVGLINDQGNMSSLTDAKANLGIVKSEINTTKSRIDSESAKLSAERARVIEEVRAQVEQ